MLLQEKLYDFALPYPEKDDRRVRVFVPAHEEGERLPVVYMTDGQNLFDEETATWGCWHTREAVRAEQTASGRAAVIVGIHNDNPWRDNELTPGSIGEVVLASEMERFSAPEGEIFDRFVMETVKPYVERHFPVRADRNGVAFCGSSSGGLQAFFTALCHPDSFCASGVFSPAFLLYAQDDMRRFILSKLQAEMPYLYIYTGAGDDLEQRIFESVEWTYDILMECYPMHLLNEVVLFDQRHHESAWDPIFKDFLHTFLFGGENS